MQKLDAISSDYADYAHKVAHKYNAQLREFVQIIIPTANLLRTIGNGA